MPTRRDDEPEDFEPEVPRDEGRPRRGEEPSLRDLARRVLKTGADALSGTQETIRKGPGVRLDAKELASSVVNLTARGREEVLNLVVREVKSYLERLNLMEEFHALVTNYSLEVHASIRLKQVPEAQEEAAAEGEGAAAEERPSARPRKPRARSAASKGGRNRG